MRTYILFLIMAIISSMKVSKKGIQFIKEIEKCKLEAYQKELVGEQQMIIMI